MVTEADRYFQPAAPCRSQGWPHIVAAISAADLVVCMISASLTESVAVCYGLMQVSTPQRSCWPWRTLRIPISATASVTSIG